MAFSTAPEDRKIRPFALIRAAGELLRARLSVARFSANEMAQLLDETAVTDSRESAEVPSDLLQIAYLIPRVAARLPFRSDCLVQALAARRWLTRLGHRSQLHLGTRKQDAGRPFEAHAWLTCSGIVVTGGDINDYTPFRILAPTRHTPPSAS